MLLKTYIVYIYIVLLLSQIGVHVIKHCRSRCEQSHHDLQFNKFMPFDQYLNIDLWDERG